MDAVCRCINVNKLITLSILFGSVLARKHTQIFKDDTRPLITLSTFGFVPESYLYVEVSHMLVDPLERDGKFGFTLDKSLNSGTSPFLEDQTNGCHLNRSNWNAGNSSVVYFVIDFTNKKLLINRSDASLKMLSVTMEKPTVVNASDGAIRTRRDVDILSDAYLMETSRRRFRRQLSTVSQPIVPSSTTTKAAVTTPILGPLSVSIPITVSESGQKDTPQGFSFHFMVKITRPEEQGLYNFIFHNCLRRRVSMSVNFEERNPGSYLSIGQQPLPILFFVFCVVYVFVGCFWLWVLCSSREGVFKIHYLMLALTYIKALAMLFHGVNFHFIGVEGKQEEAFAVLFYIMYLIKGIFMFVTIALIGAGWTFVKHVLSNRDKKIFVVVIPLQILANVATIIIDESEEGMMYYEMLNRIFLVIDLICCGAILFPVIWSIRHLQQASETDGKAAINLQKLKIFRHFYILVVCYIYFTRIIVLLVRIAVRFQYEWLDQLFVELATLAFFILTGYKFRPASNNPYLQLSQSDDEEEMDEVLTRSGALESVTKVNNKTRIQTTDLSVTLKQRESSHEFD